MQAASWQNNAELKATFLDADRTSGNVYAFNLTLVYYKAGEMDIVWVGNHDEYMSTLKNSKHTIKQFLKKKGYDI